MDVPTVGRRVILIRVWLLLLLLLRAAVMVRRRGPFAWSIAVIKTGFIGEMTKETNCGFPRFFKEKNTVKKKEKEN